jgi:hypothetical protein
MPKRAILLLIISFFPSLGFSQVIGRYVPGVTAPDNYPIIDLSADSKAHANLAINSSEAARAARYDTDKRPPIYNEKDPMRSGEIAYTRILDYGKGYEPLHLYSSDTVAIGTISSATPHMSKSGTAVYSTFIFTPTSVIKGSIAVNKAITVDREGGYVLYPSGKRRYIGVANNGLPVPGYRYLLSLKASPEGNSYTILGGYALLGSHVLCLDRGGDDLNSLNDDALVAKVKEKLAAQ